MTSRSNRLAGALVAAVLTVVASAGCTVGAKKAGLPSPATPTTSTTGPARSAVPSTTSPPVPPLSAGQIGPRSEVPWPSVGPGWLLATRADGQAVYDGQNGLRAAQLYLVDPAGGAYNLGIQKPADYFLDDWSGDGRRALFLYATSHPRSAIVVDLQTGRQTTIEVPGTTALFSRPDGTAVLAGPGLKADGSPSPTERLDLTGHVQVSYPTAFPSVGIIDGDFQETPDGTTLLLGGPAGFEVVTNAGAPIRYLPLPGQSKSCFLPEQWWRPGIAVVLCDDHNVWAIPLSGGPPSVLTTFSYGHREYQAFLPSGVFQLRADDCGSINWSLSRDGSGGQVGPVTQPAVSDQQYPTLIGSLGSRLALLTVPCAADGSQPVSLSWFDPLTGVAQPLLTGAVDAAVLFHTPST